LQAIKDDESIYQASETEKMEELDQEHTDEGAVKFSTYKDYWTMGGSYFAIIFMVFLFIAAQVCATAADIWVAYWTTVEQERIYFDEEDDVFMSTENCIIIYGTILVVLFITVMSRSFLFYILSMRSSLRLHDKMFTSLVRAPMAFFSWNPAGRILNRYKVKNNFNY